ncbi:MAG: hypothetical protein JO001_12640 [Alphaproteobacteria bacterium]|nr:hypothetical protein [Alphaproteobacteria bacterium]
MTASWLKQMGGSDVAVLVADPTGGDWVSGPYQPHTLGIDSEGRDRRAHRPAEAVERRQRG